MLCGFRRDSEQELAVPHDCTARDVEGRRSPTASASLLCSGPSFRGVRHGVRRCMLGMAAGGQIGSPRAGIVGKFELTEQERV